MVRELYSKLIAVENGTKKYYRELVCEDGDTIPKDETVTGSKCVDVTNGTVFMFSETADEWVQEFSIQG